MNITTIKKLVTQANLDKDLEVRKLNGCIYTVVNSEDESLFKFFLTNDKKQIEMIWVDEKATDLMAVSLLGEVNGSLVIEDLTVKFWIDGNNATELKGFGELYKWYTETKGKVEEFELSNNKERLEEVVENISKSINKLQRDTTNLDKNKNKIERRIKIRAKRIGQLEKLTGKTEEEQELLNKIEDLEERIKFEEDYSKKEYKEHNRRGINLARNNINRLKLEKYETLMKLEELRNPTHSHNADALDADALDADALEANAPVKEEQKETTTTQEENNMTYANRKEEVIDTIAKLEKVLDSYKGEDPSHAVIFSINGVRVKYLNELKEIEENEKEFTEIFGEANDNGNKEYSEDCADVASSLMTKEATAKRVAEAMANIDLDECIKKGAAAAEKRIKKTTHAPELVEDISNLPIEERKLIEDGHTIDTKEEGYEATNSKGTIRKVFKDGVHTHNLRAFTFKDDKNGMVFTTVDKIKTTHAPELVEETKTVEAAETMEDIKERTQQDRMKSFFKSVDLEVKDDKLLTMTLGELEELNNKTSDEADEVEHTLEAQLKRVKEAFKNKVELPRRVAQLNKEKTNAVERVARVNRSKKAEVTRIKNATAKANEIKRSGRVGNDLDFYDDIPF